MEVDVGGVGRYEGCDLYVCERGGRGGEPTTYQANSMSR